MIPINTQPDQWDNHSSSDGTGSCQFSDGSYYIQKTNGNYIYCSTNSTFGDFAWEVQMTIVQGDCGGLIFRDDFASSKYYYYKICHDGSYNLIKYVDTQTRNAKTLRHGDSSASHTGLNQPNEVAIVATGGNIIMYMNSKQIASIQDTSYSEGQIALVADSTNNPTEVSFSNARVWTL